MERKRIGSWYWFKIIDDILNIFISYKKCQINHKLPSTNRRVLWNIRTQFLCRLQGKKQTRYYFLKHRIKLTLKIPTLKIFWIQFYPHESIQPKNNSSGTTQLTKDSISICDSCYKARCSWSTGKTWQKAPTEAGSRNRHLPYSRGIVFAMLWWTHSTNYHQLCWERSFACKS